MSDMYSLDCEGMGGGGSFIGGGSCPSSSSDENARGELENGFRTAGAGLCMDYTRTCNDTICHVKNYSIFGHLESRLRNKKIKKR